MSYEPYYRMVRVVYTKEEFGDDLRVAWIPEYDIVLFRAKLNEEGGRIREQQEYVSTSYTNPRYAGGKFQEIQMPGKRITLGWNDDKTPRMIISDAP